MERLVAFLNISLETANRFYTFGWGLSVTGAVITMLGVALLFWGTRIRDHEFEKQMTILNLEAATARERAGRLEERSASLENETAKARQETTEAQRDLIALRGQTAFRMPLGGKMVPLLKQGPGAVQFSFSQEDFESLAVVHALTNIFAAAGWRVLPFKPATARELFDRYHKQDWWTVTARSLPMDIVGHGLDLSYGPDRTADRSPLAVLIASMNIGLSRPETAGRIFDPDPSMPEGVLRVIIFPR